MTARNINFGDKMWLCTHFNFKYLFQAFTTPPQTVYCSSKLMRLKLHYSGIIKSSFASIVHISLLFMSWRIRVHFRIPFLHLAVFGLHLKKKILLTISITSSISKCTIFYFNFKFSGWSTCLMNEQVIWVISYIK